ncbi:MAG: rhodanese-like domain-containing protein [Burkholderiaceae bacterium]
MKRYADLLADAQTRVREIMPWDLRKRLAAGHDVIVLDVREPAEFDAAHIAGSINVPRGVLEQACEWDFDETVPELAGGRDRAIVVVCRSGHRSLLAADVMQTLGFSDVVSLKTGVRGWNDFEQPLVDASGATLDADAAERLLAARVRPEQRRPAGGPVARRSAPAGATGSPTSGRPSGRLGKR